MGIPTLSDVTSDTTTADSQSTDADANNDDEPILNDVFEDIGADMDRVERFRDARDEDRFQQLTEQAEIYAGDRETEQDGLSGDEALEAIENYSAGQYVYQLIRNFANDRRDGDGYQAWSSAFFGASDGSDEGTYNYWQNLCRDNDLKLDLHRVMFPEPTEHFPGEPVNVTKDSGLSKWDTIGLPHEDGARDTHVFVTMDYVESFSDYANDNGIPLPPAELPEGANTDDSSKSPTVEAGEVDPGEYTVDELRDVVDDIDDVEVLAEMLTVERQNKQRKTAKGVILARMGDLD